MGALGWENRQAKEPHFGNKGYSHGNIVQGNYIGTDKNGVRRIGNGHFGIWLFHTQRALIGGERPGEGNLISGNGFATSRLSGYDGIGVSGAYRPGDTQRYELKNLISSDIRILGNRIGVKAKTNQPLPNKQFGVFVRDSKRVSIGSDSRAGSNVISKNGDGSVRFAGQFANTHRVSKHNFID